MNPKLRNLSLFVQSSVRARPVKPVIVTLLAVLMLIALSACDLTGLPIQDISPNPTPAASNAPSAPDTTAPLATTPTPGARSSNSPSAATVAAIKAVIQKANDEEVQAFASGNPSVMADTATTSYYQQMAQSFSDMESAGITAIQLTKLAWGPISLQDANTAQANTTETWTTTYSDGSTTQSSDANVYTLVLQNGSWKIQDDQHPNAPNTQPSQPQPGAPGSNDTNPVAPSDPSAPNETLPSAATPTPGAQSSDIPSATSAAIKAVIQKANQEEIQAFASGNPSVMADTATTSYYQQMAQNYSDMANSGITTIELTKLAWGPISLQDANTAQANTTETWTTTYSDGSTTQSSDANVYTLVLQNGSWKIQDDQQPDTRTLQPDPTAPGGAPTPVAPGSGQTDPVSPPTGTTTDQSSNWAGYAATGGTFTSVTGTWKVPNVSAANGTTVAADATWAGIGGVDTTDLIQAGTQATVEGGQVVYSAWWETLPQGSVTVPLDVSAGDNINVAINQQAGGTWKIVIRNLTTGQSFQKSLSYRSSLSSAEWIEESPSTGRGILPLDDFGSVNITQGTATEDGKQVTIAQAGGQPISLYGSSVRGRYGRPGGFGGQSGQAIAQPSALGSDGSSFSVTRTK